MQTKDEAKSQVIQEWRAWSKQRGSFTSTDMFLFFGWVQQNKPHLLMFRSDGDKWQVVHGWLLRDEDLQSKLRAAST